MTFLRPALLSALLTLAAAAGAGAQTYPTQTVRIVVPFGAGSVTDGLARLLADKLGKMWNQQVIVENRPGVPGTTSVAQAAPDGYTLMMTSNGHTIAGVVSKTLQYDPVKDFAGVTQVAAVPFAMIVPTDLPVKSVRELIDLAKQKPRQLNFSSAGVASTTFLATEIFLQDAGIEMQHVPYKGVPDAVNAVIRGDAQLYFAPIPNAQELSAAGKVRALAVTAAKRLPQLPNLPPIAEAGVPSYKYESWFGILAPAHTPRPIVEQVSRDIAAVLKQPDVIELLTVQGSIPTSNTPQEFDAIIRADTERYSAILRKAGVGAQ